MSCHVGDLIAATLGDAVAHPNHPATVYWGLTELVEAAASNNRSRRPTPVHAQNRSRAAAARLGARHAGALGSASHRRRPPDTRPDQRVSCDGCHKLTL